VKCAAQARQEELEAIIQHQAQPTLTLNRLGSDTGSNQSDRTCFTAYTASSRRAPQAGGRVTRIAASKRESKTGLKKERSREGGREGDKVLLGRVQKTRASASADLHVARLQAAGGVKVVRK